MKFFTLFLVLSTSLAQAADESNILNCLVRQFKDNKQIDSLVVQKKFKTQDIKQTVTTKDKRFEVTLFGSAFLDNRVSAQVFDAKNNTTATFPELNLREVYIQDGYNVEDSRRAPKVPKGYEMLVIGCEFIDPTDN